MSFRRVQLWIFASLILLAFALLWIARLRAPESFDWSVHYQHQSDQPYGAKVLMELLPNYLNGKVELIKLPLSTGVLGARAGTYVVIRERFNLRSTEVDSLYQWVERGNTALIACSYGLNVLSEVCIEEDSAREWWDEEILDSLSLNFQSETLALERDHVLQYWFMDSVYPNAWSLMEADSLLSIWPEAEAIGVHESGWLNAVRLPMGSGSVILLSTPMVLSNMELITPPGRDYAERLLSYIPQGDVFYDLRLISHDFSTNYQEGPLRFVMQHVALRWAWYLLLIGILLFIVFHTRRRQAAIPIFEPRENQSMEYLHSLAALYLQQRRDHRIIARMMREQFLSFIRDQYPIRQPALDAETALRLSRLSGIDLEAIESLFLRFQGVDQEAEFEDYALLRLNRELQNFYKNYS